MDHFSFKFWRWRRFALFSAVVVNELILVIVRLFGCFTGKDISISGKKSDNSINGLRQVWIVFITHARWTFALLHICHSVTTFN